MNVLACWAVEYEAALVIDRPGGMVALPLHLCWSAGVAVGYVHGTAMVRAQPLLGDGETNPKEAFVPADEPRARPELPCGYDADVRADANRLTNRPRLLGTHWPPPEQAFDERLDTGPDLAVLAKYPSGPALARAIAKRIAARLEPGALEP